MQGDMEIEVLLNTHYNKLRTTAETQQGFQHYLTQYSCTQIETLQSG